MTVEVSNPSLANDLIESLTAMGCVALRKNERWVEVRSGWPLNDSGGFRHFDTYLQAWEAQRDGWAIRVN